MSVSAANFQTRWTKQISSGVGLTDVAVADGRLFVSTTGYFNGQFIYALDASTGDQLWKVDYGSVFSVNPPSYSDGVVYLQTGNHGSDSWLRGLDAATGEQRFQSAYSAQWEHYLAPTVYKNQVYVNAGYYGGMQMFRKDTGVSKWFIGMPQYDGWTPAVDERYAYSFVGSTFHAVDRLTGELAFKIPDPASNWQGSGQAPVLGGKGDAYVTSGGRLLMFNLTDRSIRWAKDDAAYKGQPALAGGVVFSPANVGVIGRTQVKGKRVWNWWVPSTESVASNLVVTNTHLFVATNAATYAVDLQTQKTVWSERVSGRLAVADGYLYISQSTGKLTAVKLTP
ncbi:outer membrane protein assembly factor BamB family protein [Ideonella paludis]|uniref:PQQ-binding-like beta-propeller repeat protein n=1 Tax=Ideonella paludis TaxID=1233411 RepID=A0ABS5E2X0_9BURK|nr:PQQ-binding-like beta-propeller repeat protein [Ideonella paludis]MBQ0937763.1 PQQ-binding-like beta-propeller repeat protein [Ideonella paludis]